MAPVLPVADAEQLLQQLASLPVEVHQEGSLVLAAGTSTGKLLVLREGAVEVVIEGVRIALISEPGAVFGELALLLGQPHGADVRALRPSTFHVAEGGASLRTDPTAALYVATVLARRLEAVNRHLIEARNRSGPAPQPGVLGEMIENIAESLQFGPPL